MVALTPTARPTRRPEEMTKETEGVVTWPVS